MEHRGESRGGGSGKKMKEEGQKEEKRKRGKTQKELEPKRGIGKEEDQDPPRRQIPPNEKIRQSEELLKGWVTWLDPYSRKEEYWSHLPER